MPRFLLLALASLFLLSPAARAETTLCTEITTLPATITTQGIYCLKKDLATAIASGNAISIQANNVTLDCNGRKLGGAAAGAATQAVGIWASMRNNITVRNCNVRGFHTGILIDDPCGDCMSSGHLVEDNLADFNTKVGLYVYGDHTVVRNNRVINTGDSVIGGDVIGIYLQGQPILGEGNFVSGVYGPNFAADTKGLRIGGYMSTARDNTIFDVVNGSNGSSAGLAIGGTTVSAFGNLIANTGSPLTYGVDVTYSALCVGNTVRGATNAWDGCTDGGHNYPAIP